LKAYFSPYKAVFKQKQRGNKESSHKLLESQYLDNPLEVIAEENQIRFGFYLVDSFHQYVIITPLSFYDPKGMLHHLLSLSVFLLFLHDPLVIQINGRLVKAPLYNTAPVFGRFGA
jgi:hypothetical protein